MAVPILCTAVAFAGINFGLALLIVAAIGVPSFAPLWLAVAALVIGLLSAALSVQQWRQYLAARRDF
jgi:membrane protein implicated in regulation of membrane protease activity